MTNAKNSSIVDTIHQRYLMCLPNKGSIFDKSIDVLRNTK